MQKIGGSELDLGRVLDVGCAVGGLANALEEKFSVQEYVGVDVNMQAIKEAERMISAKEGECSRRFQCGDIVEIESLEPGGFDTVFSFGCPDWNISTREIISSCWEYVKQDGYFVFTLRLSPEPSVVDMSESYQYIYFGESLPENRDALEKAPYVVLNVREALSILSNLNPKPESILLYGYWGEPSRFAVTPYKRLVFSAIALRKASSEDVLTELECHLPVDLIL
ncbi:MAG: class I SAM-dependent methyltransferase [Candidatus Thorarchaeota archaeon]